MTPGFLELVVLLTTLGGFGVDANPKAPSGNEVMKYAPADADFMLHVDMQAVLPRNYNFLKSLPTNKQIAAKAAAKKVVEDAIREIDIGVNMAKGALQLDPINDLHSMTVWAKLPSAGQPEVLLIVRGKVTDTLLDAASNMGGKRLEIAGNKALESPDGDMLMVVGKGEMFFGTPNWVKARVDGTWRAPRIAGGSPAADMRTMLNEKPFFMIASTPSEQAVRRMLSEVPDDNVLTDLISGHEFGALSFTSKGMSWNFHARGQEGYRRALMASEGVLDLFRASHIGTRALAQIALSAMYSYRGKVKEIDAILQHEQELMGVLDQFTGDGKFKADVKKNAKKFQVSVKATGKKLSDVLPLMGILPGVGAALFLSARESSGSERVAQAESEQEAKAVEPKPAPPPAAAAAVMAPSGLNIQTIYRAAKQARGM